MNRWPMVTLGELVSQINRTEAVNLEKEYRLLGIRLEGNGPFLRETVTGTETSASRLNRVCKGDFIYSRLYAWRGAFGVINSDLDGCFVSNEFPIFHVDETQMDIAFLNRWFQLPSVWRLVEDDCSGSTPTTRNRFKEQFFCELQVPLPSLAEQHAIVARLNQLADKVGQVNEHLAAAEYDAFRLLILMATRRDLSDEQRIEMGWKETTIGDFTKLALFPVKVDANEAYQNIGIYSFARGLFEKPPIEGTRTSAKTLYQIRSGQFIYSRLFAFEGAYALVPPEYDGFYVSNEFPTFDIDLAKATPSFLITLFLTEQDWQELAMSSKGVGDRRLRIQPDKILHRKVWLPPLEDQKRIEKLFDAYHALKAKHAKIRKANQALIPATLELLFSSNQDKVNTN